MWLPSEFLRFFVACEIFKRDVLDSAPRPPSPPVCLDSVPFCRSDLRGVSRGKGEGAGGVAVGSLDPTPRVATNTRGLSAAKVEHG